MMEAKGAYKAQVNFLSLAQEFRNKNMLSDKSDLSDLSDSVGLVGLVFVSPLS